MLIVWNLYLQMENFHSNENVQAHAKNVLIKSRKLIKVTVSIDIFYRRMSRNLNTVVRMLT